MPDKSIFFDIDRVLSYNALFNFVVGSRGVGKTYGSKKRGIKNFIKNGSQFIYTRRYNTELDRGKNDKFFNDIIKNQEFPGAEFKVSGMDYMFEGKTCGGAMALSTAKAEKGVPYPDVGLIIFDEFIIDKGVYHYLPDEVINFLELYETIARLRDVTVLFLSNALTVTNPYFMYFDLEIPRNKNKIVRKGDDILLAMAQNEEYINAKKQTRFGKIIEGTSYANYAIDNQFLRDSDTFIEQKSGSATYLFTFKYLANYYGVWISYNEGKLWVSEHVDPSCKIVYSLTLDDHTPNTMMIKRLQTAVMFKMLVDNYKRGQVYFENVNIKNIVYNIIRLTL
jgi:hypothetical protein